LAVERGQAQWIPAIEDDVMHPADHREGSIALVRGARQRLDSRGLIDGVLPLDLPKSTHPKWWQRGRRMTTARSRDASNSATRGSQPDELADFPWNTESRRDQQFCPL
jgi:hypothetical protein